MLQPIQNAIEYFVKYPILANILIAITLIGGIATLASTKKSFFPSIEMRNISISVTYPGASPEEMEEGVTLKIEEAINNIAGIDEIRSTSSENQASITIETLKGFDLDEIFTEVKNSVDAISSFPQNAEKPVIFKVKPQSTTQWVGLTGDVDLFTLKKYAESIKEDLLESGIISQVSLSGFNDREVSIELSEINLLKYGLTFDQVANAVRTNNKLISGGTIKSSNEEILIRSNAKSSEADKIADIVVRSNQNGSELLLRDVATVKEQFVDSPNKWTLNGKPAVWVEVRKLETEDLEAISSYVNKYIDEFNSVNSAVKLTNAFDFMDYLGQRLDMLYGNGLMGLVLVLLALGIFLNVRLAFWVAWGIPSSFLGLFIIGSMVGLTINMISLFGMILVIGILVDDGIVIAENIYSHFEKSGNAVEAAVKGTMEVIPAVFTSVLTTIIAFTPLLILTGGFEFLKDMAIVVIGSLAFSLLEAFFVLPAHLASKSVLKIKKEDTRSYKIRKKINGFIDWLRYGLYGKVLALTMKYRVISFAFLISIFPIVGGLMKGGVIETTFFPRIPFTNFSINVVFTPGTRVTKVEEHIKRFEQAIWKVNQDIMDSLNQEEDIIKFTFSATGNTMNNSDQGEHTGGMSIFYRELDDVGINSFDLIDQLREEIGVVAGAEKFNIGGGNQFGKPVSLRLIGTDMKQLREGMKFVKRELEGIAELKEVEDNAAMGRRELELDLTSSAFFMGLSQNDITSQVRQGFFGEEVQRLQKGKDEVRVWVRYPKSGRISIGQLEQMKIKTQAGENIPLSQLADYSVTRNVSGIRHHRAKRAITVEASMVDPFGEVPPIIDLVNNDIIPRLKQKFPELEVDSGGQAEESEKAGKEIGMYFGGAFLLMFFVIMITFRSFYQAVLVLSMIPIGWVGAAIGHGIEGHPVSLLSAWGMIALSGIIINDAVVFLAKFNSLIKEEGQSVYYAAYNAGIARFRPIVLTSVTTILGLYPLIIETSFQAQFLIPMAIAVAYGVLIGTFIILLFFPVMILIFNDIRRITLWLWTGQKPSAEDVERVLIDSKRLEEYKKSA